MTSLLLISMAYLLGSLSTAVLVSKAFGLPDPREQGSGNPGATNVLRLGGKKAAILTLLGDALKGFVPVVVANLMGMNPLIVGLVGLAAFLGHLYPVFFGFKGGKGVATALGVMSGFFWGLGLAVLATWIGVAALTRYSSLAALVAAALAPLYVWFMLGHLALSLLTLLLAALLFWRHRANIQRLIHGEESRIGKKTG
jgi:glycerol-3-phosphate acyltransferase PlsY